MWCWLLRYYLLLWHWLLFCLLIFSLWKWFHLRNSCFMCVSSVSTRFHVIFFSVVEIACRIWLYRKLVATKKHKKRGGVCKKDVWTQVRWKIRVWALVKCLTHFISTKWELKQELDEGFVKTEPFLCRSKATTWRMDSVTVWLRVFWTIS